MAKYESPTVVQPPIPERAITPLEQLLLSNMFQSRWSEDKVYFFAMHFVDEVVVLDPAELRRAYRASRSIGGQAVDFVARALADAEPDASTITLDVTTTSWEFFFQDIIRRESTLNYVSVISAWTCSTMKANGFGGMAVLITADRILGKSTDDLINDFLDEVDPGHTFAR
jgi:hypothetical protein